MLRQMRSEWKQQAKRALFQLARATGRLESWSAAERELVRLQPVAFQGDITKGAGDQHNQFLLGFQQPRPRQQSVSELLYTPRGMAWQGGRLMERFSIQEPAAADLRHVPSIAEAKRVAVGVVVQVETPYTYGDWVGEHLMAIASAMPLKGPLFAPAPLLNRSYVRRDLRNLGVEAVPVEQAVCIENATVIHKTRPGHNCTPAEVQAVRRAFGWPEVPPEPGSMIYLSRQGVKSECVSTQAVGDRLFPSDITHAATQALGAKLIITPQTSQEQFAALAPVAETVIADHGAALGNLLLWQPRQLIMLVTDDWWDGFGLFIAHAMGIRHIALIRVDGLTEPQLRERIGQHLADFGQARRA